MDNPVKDSHHTPLKCEPVNALYNKRCWPPGHPHQISFAAGICKVTVKDYVFKRPSSRADETSYKTLKLLA